ncbi:MAG: hypothetical protein ACYCPQ_06500 [Elusimicrobiota bacterium]
MTPDQREAYSRYHETLVAHLKDNEEDFAKVLAPLLTAVGGYGYMLFRVFKDNYALALAYNYRNMQITVARLEKAICLSQVVPESWNPCRQKGKFSCGCQVLPTIFEVHVVFLFLAILAIVILHAYMMSHVLAIPSIFCPYLSRSWTILAAVVLLILFSVVCLMLKCYASKIRKNCDSRP